MPDNIKIMTAAGTVRRNNTARAFAGAEDDVVNLGRRLKGTEFCAVDTFELTWKCSAGLGGAGSTPRPASA